MTHIDDYDTSGDEHLDVAGRQLRQQASGHPGDLGALFRRVDERRRRVLRTVAAACVLVILVVIGLGRLVADGSGRVQAGAGGDQTVITAAAPTAAGAPTWTVNPRFRVGADEEVWAVEFVYDRAAGSFMSLTQDIPPSYAPPVQFIEEEPGGIVEVYWTGPNARAAAEAVRDFLTGRPGIVSVAAARAVNGDAPPRGTTPPGTTPSGRGIPVWTVPRSLGMSGSGIWALEVVYDPAQWDTGKLTGALSGAMVSSTASGDEPRAYAFWSGPTAHADADAARARLGGQPGIASVSLGRARVSVQPEPPASTAR
jgi:hypothetical protein